MTQHPHDSTCQVDRCCFLSQLPVCHPQQPVPQCPATALAGCELMHKLLTPSQPSAEVFAGHALECPYTSDSSSASTDASADPMFCSRFMKHSAQVSARPESLRSRRG